MVDRSVLHFDYDFQFPYFYSSFVSRTFTTPKIKRMKDTVEVDLTNLRTEDEDIYVTGSLYIPTLAGAVWSSIMLNSRDKEDIKTFRTFWPDELALWKDAASRQLIFVQQALNKILEDTRVRFKLYKCAKWESVIAALAEGYTVMVGGVFYDSFLKVVSDSIVPIPKANEPLLGSHIFNITSFDIKNDLATAIGNLGKGVGNRGFLNFRGSYLRNLCINRDFFVLKPESVWQPQ